MAGFYFLKVEFVDELLSDGQVEDYLAYLSEFARLEHRYPKALKWNTVPLREHGGPGTYPPLFRVTLA